MEEKLQTDLKSAMRSRDEVAVSTLRMLLSELKYLKIQKNSEISDSDVITVIQKEVKKRQEAIEGFRGGGREESAQKEEAEMTILQNYLPTQISDEELTKVIKDCINELGATVMSDMGRVISSVMTKVGASAQGARVSSLVKAQLTIGDGA